MGREGVRVNVLPGYPVFSFDEIIRQTTKLILAWANRNCAAGLLEVLKIVHGTEAIKAEDCFEFR